MCSQTASKASPFETFLSPYHFSPSLFSSDIQSNNSRDTSDCPLSPATPLAVEEVLQTPKSAKMASPLAPKSKNLSSCRRLNLMESDSTNETSPKSPVCRNLFNTPKSGGSDQSWKAWMQQCNDERLQMAKKKYNFDFRSFAPVKNEESESFEWSQVDDVAKIPSFYTSERQKPPRSRHMSGVGANMSSHDFKKIIEIEKLDLGDVSETVEHPFSVPQSSSSIRQQSRSAISQLCTPIKPSRSDGSTSKIESSQLIQNDVVTRSASKTGSKLSQQLITTPFKSTPVKSSSFSCETPVSSSISTRKRALLCSSSKKSPSGEIVRQPEITDFIPACKKSRSQVKRKL